MRTTKTERRENAKRFYTALKHTNRTKAAIVVNKVASTSNPNVIRCQFIATIAAFKDSKPVVIAESLDGVTGCFCELFNAVTEQEKNQKYYYEDGFADWLKSVHQLRITYNDGYVILLER